MLDMKDIELCKMYLKDGMLAREIAEAMGISASQVLRILRRNGVKLRGRGGAIAVKCVETGKVYDTVYAAAEANYVGYSTLLSYLKGRQKTCCGLHFEKVK